MNKFLRSRASKIIFAGAFAMLLLASQAAAQKWIAISKKMEAHRQAVVSLRADIKWTKYDPVLKENETYDGKIMFVNKTKKQDYMFRVDWQSPRNETIAVSGGKYIAYKTGSTEAQTGAANSQKLNDGSVFSFLRMSKAQLQSTYNPPEILADETLPGSVQTFHFKFTPKSKSTTSYVEIWVDNNGMIVQARMVPKGGDQSMFRLTNIEKNPNLKTDHFVVTLPQGTRVVNT